MQEELIRFDKTIKLLFIDFETANLCLSHRFNLPWQMATLRTVGGEIVKGSEKDTLINWGKDFKFSKGARAMAHSYSQDRMEREGVEPRGALEILSKELSWCDGIAGHNILGFDIYLIKAIYDKVGKPLPDILSRKLLFDTLPLSRGLLGKIPMQKGENPLFYQYKLLNQKMKGVKASLSSMAKYFNIEVDEKLLHDGIYDLGLNVQVWNKLKFQINYRKK